MFDPVVRFVARQTVRVVFLALLVAALAIAVDGGVQPEFLRVCAMFPLLYAVPHAASRIVDMDRAGRLDHLRLSGQAPGRLLLSFMVGAGGPWMVAAFPLLAVSLRNTAPDLTAILAFVVLVMGSIALSMLALALPRREIGADSRILTLGLVWIAMIPASAQQSFLGVATRGISVGALALEMLVIALTAGAVVRSIARPGPRRLSQRRSPASHSRWVPTRLRGGWMVSTRAGVGVAVITLGLIAVLRAMAWRFSRPMDLTSASIIAFLPLVVGAIAVSSVARADRETGRFDLSRLDAARPMVTLAGLTLGIWLPFILATGAVATLVVVLWGALPLGWHIAAAVIAVTAALPLVEGWHQRFPMTYTFPIGILFIVMIGAENVWLGHLPVWRNAALLKVLCLCWLGWVAAVRTLRRPDQSPLAGWAGVAAVICFTIVALWPDVRPLANFGKVSTLVATLLMTAEFTVDFRSPRRLDRFGQALAVTAAGAVMTLVGGHRAIDAVLVGASAGAAWWVGRRIHQAAADHPAISTGTRVLLALFFVTEAVLLVTGGYRFAFDRRNAPEYLAIVTSGHVLLASTVMLVALLAEAAYRLIPRAAARVRAIRQP